MWRVKGDEGEGPLIGGGWEVDFPPSFIWIEDGRIGGGTQLIFPPASVKLPKVTTTYRMRLHNTGIIILPMNS